MIKKILLFAFIISFLSIGFSSAEKQEEMLDDDELMSTLHGIFLEIKDNQLIVHSKEDSAKEEEVRFILTEETTLGGGPNSLEEIQKGHLLDVDYTQEKKKRIATNIWVHVDQSKDESVFSEEELDALEAQTE